MIPFRSRPMGAILALACLLLAATALVPRLQAGPTAVPIVVAVAPHLEVGPTAALVAAAPSKDALKLASSSNAFGFELYARLRAEPGNIVLSPYGAWSALAMAYTGARGKTAAQLEDALRLPDRKHLSSRALDLRHALLEAARAGGATLTVANALWAQKSLAIPDAQAQALEAGFEGALYPVSFGREPEAAREAIDAWARTQTGGHIPTLLPPGALTIQTRLVLTSVVDLSGVLPSGFAASSTEHPFRLSATQFVRVPFRYSSPSQPIRFGRTDDATVLELGGDPHSLIVLMPHTVDGLAKLEPEFDEKRLRSALKSASDRQGVVGLPALAVSSAVPLARALAAMGMPDAFGPAADFTGLSPDTPGLAISEMRQKSRIDVFGVDAQADAGSSGEATGSPAGGGGAPDADAGAAAAEPLKDAIEIDRPFLFAVRDRRTGTILLMGRIVDPRE